MGEDGGALTPPLLRMNNQLGDAVITALLEGLNPPQKQAVTMPTDRHCLVLAGAGCGKTAVLTRRIAFCAHTFCEQQRILALTFTRKAADEMKTRLMRLAGIDARAPLPTVTTFHGFGLRILHDTVNGIPNARRLGYEQEPRLMTEEERLALLAAITSIDQRKSLGVTILELDSLLERYMCNPMNLRGLPAAGKEQLASIADEFLRVKIARNFSEFSDMIIKVIDLLSRYPELAQHYAQKFSSILVDEFQDTNPLQISMLNTLQSETNTVFAVGDDDQAIYGFRGADIGPILHFKDHFPQAEIVKLETNYRSTPAILNAANRIFADKQPQYRKVLIAGRYAHDAAQTGRKPEKHSFTNDAAMVQWILETGKRIEKQEAVPLCEMAVLFRVNETLQRIQHTMRRNGAADTSLPKFLTVHGSKGLEFPVVFLCDLEESVFPSYRMTRSRHIRTWGDLIKKVFCVTRREAIECDFDEEKRLFYVAVTRAEQILFLIHVKEKRLHGRTIAMEPSRFLKLV